MSFELITSERRLTEVLAAHESEQFVAVDTEFRRRDTFYPQVALVQLCWRETAYLIDPTTFSDFSGLRELLVNEGVIKLLHSPSEDLEVFDHWLGILPTPLFDTQRAMALLGHGFGVGYRPNGGAVCRCRNIEGRNHIRLVETAVKRPATQLCGARCDLFAQYR